MKKRRVMKIVGSQEAWRSFVDGRNFADAIPYPASQFMTLREFIEASQSKRKRRNKGPV